MTKLFSRADLPMIRKLVNNFQEKFDSFDLFELITEMYDRYSSSLLERHVDYSTAEMKVIRNDLIKDIPNYIEIIKLLFAHPDQNDDAIEKLFYLAFMFSFLDERRGKDLFTFLRSLVEDFDGMLEQAKNEMMKPGEMAPGLLEHIRKFSH